MGNSFMREETSQYLNRCLGADYFAMVGRPVNSAVVAQCGNWDDALDSAYSQEFEDFRIDRHNELFKRMPIMTAGELDHVRYQDFLTDADEYFVDIVRAWKLNELPEQDFEIVRNIYREFFRKSLIIQEFPEWFGGNTFHLEMMEWFLRGHFPCGWTCEWPQGAPRVGKPIIF
jgi:hypothetical protein